jgi:hypothetical protein
MQPKKRTPTHPGEVLLEEFLEPLAVTQLALAEHIGVPVQRVNAIVRGKRRISPLVGTSYTVVSGLMDMALDIKAYTASEEDRKRYLEFLATIGGRVSYRIQQHRVRFAVIAEKYWDALLFLRGSSA